MGEIGRSAAGTGAKGGPAAFVPVRDEVTLSGKPRSGAGLYSGMPFMKSMGAVELIHGRFESEDDAGRNDFGAF